jgi:hypothetical protein
MSFAAVSFRTNRRSISDFSVFENHLRRVVKSVISNGAAGRNYGGIIRSSSTPCLIYRIGVPQVAISEN